jgi:hypothetical protein
MLENGKQVSIGRHRRNCSICAHPERDEIEADFISWCSPAAIAHQYGLTDRSSVYRHAHAFSLFDRRRINVRAALERIIEKAGEVEVTCTAIVSAIQAYSKINSSGQWIEPSEQINLRDLYDRMTMQEMDLYARTGQLPDWFTALTINHE